MNHNCNSLGNHFNTLGNNRTHNSLNESKFVLNTKSIQLKLNNMKTNFIFLQLFSVITLNIYTQTGPGGVGDNIGSSDLKLWFRPDNGVNVTGALIDSWENSAGIAALNISEAGAQRPTLVTNAVNGFSEISFSGSTRLRTGLTLTVANFVTNQASSFTVCRADNTGQTSCVYTTDPLVGTTRFSNHIPWSNTIYYDIGTCCSNDARLQVGGLVNLNTYSVWTYDASPALGKQIYRNGALLQSRPNSSTYSNHATHMFNIGGNTSGTNGFVGDVAEIIIFNVRVNSAQRIIIDNYLAAKYNLPLTSNDVFIQDNPANGDYDFDVAGIGRVDATNLHTDAQGTGIVRILNATDLNDNEFLLWGHDNGVAGAVHYTDIPASVDARFDRVWRVSEVNAAGTGVDVGSVEMRWNLNGLGPITVSDLRLLVDTDNDGIFADETPKGGAIDLGGGIYAFTGVTELTNNVRFTIATINSVQTPLPVELVSFDAKPTENSVLVTWQTASEINNDYFTVEKSGDGENWTFVGEQDGAGNSTSLKNYQMIDRNPIMGLSFYRLKQTDFDGKFSYSDVKAVNFINHSNTLTVYPNPTGDFVTIEYRNLAVDMLKIIDLRGNNLTHLVEIQKINETTVKLNLTKLPKGSYSISIGDKNSMVIKN